MQDARSVRCAAPFAGVLAQIGGAVSGLASVLDPRLLVNAGFEFLRDPIAASRFFLPLRDTPTAWREIANKVEVYVLVRESGRLLGITAGEPFSLIDLVQRAYDAGPYAALWALEGLGHQFAENVRDRGEPLAGLLRAGDIASLPPGSLLMLHAGVGLAIAQRELDAVANQRQRADLLGAVRKVIRLCVESSRPGYTGAALESIGLVTRTFHPSLVRQVDACINEIDVSLSGFFWHGVGRAIYFLPVNFLPCGHLASRTLRMIVDEAAHALPRKSATAGFAWAFTLVNQRHPDVVADLVRREYSRLAADDAFSNGVASTMAMRQDTTSDAALISSFLDYAPDPRLAARWNALVREPAKRGVAAQAELRRSLRLEQVFRYQPAEAGGVQGPVPRVA